MPPWSCGYAGLYRLNQWQITRKICDHGSHSTRRLPWTTSPFHGSVELPLNQKAKLCVIFDGAHCLMIVSVGVFENGIVRLEYSAFAMYHDWQNIAYHSFTSVFAIVTVSGCLIVYNMFVSARPIVKISAHAGDATTVDWHPTRPYIIATGGAGDRCVKSKFEWVNWILCSKNLKEELTNWYSIIYLSMGSWK